MAKRPLCVAFLWHMHQPEYGDEKTGEVYLPWTRFHAIKDYYDMGALMARTPKLHATINIVPSLIDQLLAYGEGKARETYAALTLRNAAALDENEKLRLLRTFFQMPWNRMILPYPRYRDLLERRGAPNSQGEHAGALKRFTAQDYRDLQIWFNLSWCGNELRRDPEVADLFRKGRNFTEEDKKRLLEIQTGFIRGILPYYRRLAEENGIELSVSPYYHPILPLLCDNRSARETLPDLPLPAGHFSYPGDAAEQIRRAQERFAGIFGRRPEGMWPSEGAISDAAAAAISKAGITWIASDSAVLANSLHKSGNAPAHLSPMDRYSAYSWADSELCIFFRDQHLSDLIGFTYAQWKAEDAVGDFLARLRAVHSTLPDDGRHYVVPVILDGENAWEHYANNGADFLGLLYRRLAESESLRTVTFREFLQLEPSRRRLKSIAAGSWIYGNLATWIGHPEKNQAWEALAPARQALSSSQASEPGAARCEAAFLEMMIAEGSDWFWWFGDDHETQNSAEFDTLFRTHVKNVYRLLGKPYPTGLDVPIKKTDARSLCRPPLHTFTPQIDGRVTNYFEWLGAGYATPAGGESMHRATRFLEKVYFGYDTAHFFLRVDLVSTKGSTLPPGAVIELSFLSPAACRLTAANSSQSRWSMIEFQSPDPEASARFAGDKILEAAIPLKALGIEGPAEVRFSVTLVQEGRELERFPVNGFLSVPVNPWTLDGEEWMV